MLLATPCGCSSASVALAQHQCQIPFGFSTQLLKPQLYMYTTVCGLAGGCCVTRSTPWPVGWTTQHTAITVNGYTKHSPATLSQCVIVKSRQWRGLIEACVSTQSRTSGCEAHAGLFFAKQVRLSSAFSKLGARDAHPAAASNHQPLLVGVRAGPKAGVCSCLSVYTAATSTWQRAVLLAWLVTAACSCSWHTAARQLRVAAQHVRRAVLVAKRTLTFVPSTSRALQP